ncbi:hypothetical protein ABI125_00925 [Tamlana crocina]
MVHFFFGGIGGAFLGINSNDSVGAFRTENSGTWPFNGIYFGVSEIVFLLFF